MREMLRETKAAICKKMKDIVPNDNNNDDDNDDSLFIVTVFRNCSEPDRKFALVVSMSHNIGDGHTFYSLYKMLCADREVKSLNPTRKPHVKAVRGNSKKKISMYTYAHATTIQNESLLTIFTISRM